MKLFAKILILLLLVLPGSMGNGWAEPAAEIEQAKQPESHSTHPFNQPNLFNIYHQAEHAGNSSTNIPLPLLVVDEQDLSRAYQSALLFLELKEQVWFAIFEMPNRTFVRLTFIFPFHFFL